MNGYKQIHALLQQTLKRNGRLYLLCESPEMQLDTKGLHGDFPQQVLQLPCSDEASIGIAIGLAVSGAQVILYLNGPQHLHTVLAHLLEERFGEEFPLSLTIRIPLAPNESIQSNPINMIDGSHIRAIYASTASQTLAHLRSAFEHSGVTLIFEERESLLREMPIEEPAQKSIVHQEGSHISLFAFGKQVQRAKALSSQYPQVEIIELVQLHPLDQDGIAKSMNKTGRALCVSPPQGLFKTFLGQSFWRLENQPQQLENIEANRLQSKIEELMRY